MSIEGVLAAAAALRDFTVDELAAFCDEQPPAIVTILDGARQRLERIGGDADPSDTRWRVRDLDGLRRDLAGHAEQSRAEQSRAGRALDGRVLDGRALDGRALDGARRWVGTSATTRLMVAEQALLECAAAESGAERHLLVATAKNHLRQIVASILPDERPWWSVDLSLQRLGEAIVRHSGEPASTRLKLDVALACLVEHDATGHPVPARELVDTVLRFQRLATTLEDPPLRGLVGRFFDLVMAQLVPQDRRSVPAADRLLAAVASRRVRAQVEHGVSAAMHSLVPLLESFGRRSHQAGERGLYQVLGHLPDGRDRILVYADLLQILPRQYGWHAAVERVPGALIEAVTEPEATSCLAVGAEALARDLAHSPFGSDAALIGQAAHVFQDLADRAASLDGTVRARSDRTRSELLTLAKAQVWPSVTSRPGDQRGGERP